MKSFSEHLKEIRKDKYNSMDAVAQNSVFDSSNYNKFENGKGNPTIETILKMASAFKIPPKELFDFDFDIENIKLISKPSDRVFSIRDFNFYIV
ncbi:helix-turn-helix transcriptional regulator [Chryseobacterium gambrini]|uniref:Helix-turn-helix domain-containing protein n=1 Tax=Chryseobacterium gambrini TaxID=373672 RepID=A0ABN7CDN8_9FLAO|nr:helix-turn-helix domain-containing protein [Chryseobacterium gambrini]